MGSFPAPLTAPVEDFKALPAPIILKHRRCSESQWSHLFPNRATVTCPAQPPAALKYSWGEQLSLSSLDPVKRLKHQTQWISRRIQNKMGLESPLKLSYPFLCINPFLVPFLVNNSIWFYEELRMCKPKNVCWRVLTNILQLYFLLYASGTCTLQMTHVNEPLSSFFSPSLELVI